MVFLTVLLGVVVFINSSQVHEHFTFLIEHDLNVLQNAQKLQKLVVDAETGQRGFLITGDENFLEPYYNGIDGFDELIKIEKELISNNPAQVERLEVIEKLFYDWQENAAAPEIELARQVHKSNINAKVLQDTISSGIGKNILDDIRSEFDGFLNIENNLQGKRLQTALEIEFNTKISIIGFTITSAVSGIIFSVLLFRVIVRPITKLEADSIEMAKGNLDMDITTKGNDEISNLTRSFNIMRNSIKENIKKERVMLSEKLKNDKMVTIGELSSRMAHDMRNPLSIIRVSLENLKLKYGTDGSSEESFDRVERSIDRIAHQIDDVLDFVKGHTPELTMVKFSEIIRESFDSLVVPDTIKLNLPENDIELLADKKLFSIVLINLILNSIQAIEGAGTIEITVEENNDAVIIQVKDSGDGISKENQSNIFEMLYTTKQQGTGLGLSSVKSIVESHGGIISVTSPPTVFTITLPKILD